MEVTYRKFKEADFETLSSIISEVWEYNIYFNKKYAKLCADYDLLRNLYYSQFHLVAEVDKKPVGLIFGYHELNGPNKEFKKAYSSIKRRMLFSSKGLAMLYLTKKYSKINEKLLKKSKVSYNNEISFFIIDNKYQHMHIGKHLYEECLNYFKSIGACKYMVFTDSKSNYSFYEHMGMKLKGVRVEEINFKKDENVIFYLYEGELK